ncbi:MAG: zinc ribbon domain-containing protein [Candidatus Aenigmarchaeota archaeon]|nr:zinc ribbon domain-containing protein [Candidatus Aenigmarchaeota archaeon]
MLCDNCESELEKGWKFCPVCGAEIVYEDIFANLGNILRNITREMESDFLFRGREQPAYGSDFGRSEAAETPARRASRQPRKGGRVVEPKTSVKNLGNRIIFEVKLPGADPDNVHLTELDESYEVKAYSKDAAYFRIITVPQGFSLADQYFENDKLVLEFAA